MAKEQGNVAGLAAPPQAVDLAAQLDEFCKTLKSIHTTISKRIEADNWSKEDKKVFRNFVAGLWNQTSP